MPDLNWPILSAAAMFAAATSITPGPNNTMLLASGVNFGFRRTLPHILGISIGFFLLLLIAATGLNQWVLQNSTVRTGMKWLGSAYLLYLAWRVATADAQAIPRPQAETAHGATAAVSASHARPLSFLGAAAFQWINPKAWIMIVGYISAYVPAQAGWSDIVTLSLLFMVVGFPCICIWALLGDRLSLWLTAGTRRRWFNRSMGLLLALSVLGALLAD